MKGVNNVRLWTGRMTGDLEASFERLNASLSTDIRLVREDIDGSLAWVGGLVRAKVLTKEEGRELTQGLEQVRAIFEQGLYEPAPSDEDIHTAVERLLTEMIGPVAKKLHTGRSRNDQVTTDFSLWIMRACDRLDEMLAAFGEAILEAAEGGLDVLMPGYTHLQHARPVTWGHWMLSHFWPVMRDRQRFNQVRRSASILPLGSGALAGTPYAIDRLALASELGFSSITQNSIDAVANRDYALEFLFAASVLGIHLSRLAEALILFNSVEFGYIELDDAYATGSSLMPQKKNPDALELARGKAGRLVGRLMGLLTTLKGLPSAYDKDLQEDKEPVFDAYDTLSMLLPVLSGVVQTLSINNERMQAQVTMDSMATDLADYLVQKSVSFRDAYAIAGQAVRLAKERQHALSELELPQLQSLHPAFQADVTSIFDPYSVLARHAVVGGTAPGAVREQLKAAKKALR
jgi:argininosuccinate lyase